MTNVGAWYNNRMLWRRLNNVTLVGLLICILGAWLAYNARSITVGGMVPVTDRDGLGTGEEEWATAAERRRERYVFGALIVMVGAIFVYSGLKNARETPQDYPDRFGPWIVDKFHRIMSVVIFVILPVWILPTAIPLWTSLMEKLPWILGAAAIPTWFVVIGLPFAIGGFLATWYWQRFAQDKPRTDSG
jgi:hypothetical protein